MFKKALINYMKELNELLEYQTDMLNKYNGAYLKSLNYAAKNIRIEVLKIYIYWLKVFLQVR